MTAGKRRFFPIALLLGALIAAPAASADTVVVHDSGAQQIAALDGTIVWVTGQLSMTDEKVAA